jgi:hypothetical protein
LFNSSIEKAKSNALSTNPYLQEVQTNLPRLLALIDTDRTSRSYGLGDRYFWAWGLIDFGNATFQGAANGLARLWSSGLWPYSTPKDVFFDRLDSFFRGTAFLTRKDGSLEEAFPHEGSFCVTALVAFDLLCALDQLRGELDATLREEWARVIQPLVSYLVKADETHGLISNHLATAVAALARWHELTGDKASEAKAGKLLKRILLNQSTEGWFREYEGADPGYQTLCMCYLADVHLRRPDWNLEEPLRKSLDFLSYFSHPDGSFGGIYGSRSTRFYFPAGVLALRNLSPKAAALAGAMAKSIAQQTVVTLSAIDEPNLVPMFNAYSWSAQLVADTHEESQLGQLPCAVGSPFRRNFPDAGLWIDAGPKHYTIVSTHKGGVVAHYPKGGKPLIDGGLVVRNPKGKLGSTQVFEKDSTASLNGDELCIDSELGPMPKRLPTPIDFIILRILGMTVFRFSALREWFKRMLVRLLMKSPRKWPITNHRRISLGSRINIQDVCDLPKGYVSCTPPGPFVAIHMASQSYWQRQDEGANSL